MGKIFVYTSPATGHVYPLVPAALELVARGHEVVWRTYSREVPTLRALGMRAEPIDSRLEAIENEDWKARTPLGAQRRDAATFARRAAIELPEMRAAIADEAPDALLVDTTAFGAAAAAEASGLPWAWIAHFPLPLRSEDAPPYGPGLAPRSGALGRLRDAVVDRLVLRPLENLVKPAINEARAGAGLRPVANADELYGATAPLTIWFTAEPFEYRRSDLPETVRMVGPGAWDPPAGRPEWLSGEERPLVLVTCSTEFQDDGRLVQAALDALADDDLLIVATTAAVDPAGFRVPANARVERFLPHGPLLERAVCVVCHGGMGITQKALVYGVPVCAVPFGRDQLEVARRVVQCGAGTTLGAGKLRRPRRLAEAIREAMARTSVAAEVAQAFAGFGPGAAADAVEELLGAEAGVRAASSAASAAR